MAEPRIPPPNVNLENPSVIAILEAAEHCFSRGGFHATSLREVAQEAGVSKALIHYHFDSKESLFLEMLGLLYRQLAEEVQSIALVGEPGIAAGIRALDATAGALQRLAPLTPVFAEVGVAALRESRLRARTEKLLQETRTLIETGIARMLGEDVERLPVPPSMLASLIHSSLHGIALSALYDESSTLEQIEAFKKVLIAAVDGTPKSKGDS